MGTVDIDWRKYGQHTIALDKVLDLCADLTSWFRIRRAPMPIVVLQAERPQERIGQPRAPEPGELAGHPVDELVDALHDIYKDGRLRCKRLPVRAERRPAPPGRRSPLPPLPNRDPLRDFDDALEMARVLSAPASWESSRSAPYRPYSFPRSEPPDSIERAVSDSVPESGQACRGPDGSSRPGGRVQPA